MALQRNLRNFLAVSAFALLGTAYGAEMAPDLEVKAATEDVLAAVAKTADLKTLNELAETKVVPHFDFRRMTRLAAGRAWTEASPEQQDKLTSEFQHLLVRTYTRALASAQHSAVKVAVQPARPQEGSDETLVKTTVTEAGRKPLAVNYRMERSAGGWKVVDVTVESISLVTNYRDWFSTQLRSGGVDAVIRALAEKNRAAMEKTG